MQTASSNDGKRHRLIAAAFILAVALSALPAFAQSPPAPPSAPMPAPPQAQPVMTPPPMAGSPVSAPSMAAEASPFEAKAPGSADDKADKGLESVKTKIPDSVKDVVKHLDSTSIVTLEDLNSARQAVARIDALIDIEKHISELQKIRQDREENATGKASKSLAAAIPASAIAPPPSFAMSHGQNLPPMNGGAPGGFMPSAAPLEIARITGSAGRYAAVIKTEGSNKSFYVGDRLPNGAMIDKITSSEVVTSQSGAQHILHVKNVDMVFGNTL